MQFLITAQWADGKTTVNSADLPELRNQLAEYVRLVDMMVPGEAITIKRIA